MTDNTIGLEKKLEIKSSLIKNLAVMVGSLGFVLIGIPRIWMLDSGSFDYVITWVGIIFFGSGLVIIPIMMYKYQGIILTLNIHGLIDRRASDMMIPWSAIQSVSIWTINWQRDVILKLDPIFEAGYPMRGKGSWSVRMGAAIGINGLPVSAMGLAISHDELLAAIKRFKQRHDDAACNA